MLGKILMIVLMTICSLASAANDNVKLSYNGTVISSVEKPVMTYRGPVVVDNGTKLSVTGQEYRDTRTTYYQLLDYPEYTEVVNNTPKTQSNKPKAVKNGQKFWIKKSIVDPKYRDIPNLAIIKDHTGSIKLSVNYSGTEWSFLKGIIFADGQNIILVKEITFNRNVMNGAGLVLVSERGSVDLSSEDLAILKNAKVATFTGDKYTYTAALPFFDQALSAINQ